jgi:hypothetical protein
VLSLRSKFSSALVPLYQDLVYDDNLHLPQLLVLVHTPSTRPRRSPSPSSNTPYLDPYPTPIRPLSSSSPNHLVSSPSSSSSSSTHLLVHHSSILATGRLGRTHLPLPPSLRSPSLASATSHTTPQLYLRLPNLIYSASHGHVDRSAPSLSPLIAPHPSSPHRQPPRAPHHRCRS